LPRYHPCPLPRSPDRRRSLKHSRTFFRVLLQITSPVSARTLEFAVAPHGGGARSILHVRVCIHFISVTDFSPLSTPLLCSAV
uniref:Uncharacterized protein n=1 Tax=Aegilops tauschii subsp. strangulata TaxID=200361 RepID=A0A453AW44_AEGTS